jgi:hypothetical protein
VRLGKALTPALAASQQPGSTTAAWVLYGVLVFAAVYCFWTARIRAKNLMRVARDQRSQKRELKIYRPRYDTKLFIRDKRPEIQQISLRVVCGLAAIALIVLAAMKYGS